MSAISPDYISAAIHAPAQLVAASPQMPATKSAASGAQADGSVYTSQAYQMTLSNATAAQAGLQTVQTQNYLIEQLHAGFGGDEV